MALFTYQRHSFENQFSTKYEADFESWFFNLARRLHPEGDCQSVRLTQGDGKIDVYAINEQLVYQCYAPQTYRPSNAVKKIKKDFRGALEHLDKSMKTWIFVHNHNTGSLDKNSIKALNDLKTETEQQNLDIKILSWGKENLWSSLSDGLSYNQLRDLFGEPSPVELDYDSLEKVLYSLERVEYNPSIDPPIEPDVGKLDFNDLGPSCKMLITMARAVDYEVGAYFGRCSDPELGEYIAEHFRNRYARLKNVDNLPPDEIFNKLQADAGWKPFPDAKRQLASMAVLSYFFHQCDVFENLPVTL